MASLAILALLIGGMDQYIAVQRCIITLLRSTLLYFTYLPTLPYFIYLTSLYLLFFSMAPTPALTDYTSLITVLDNGIQRVLSGFSPLEDLEENRLLKAVAVIGEDPDIIIGNNYRKRARTILVKLLSISLKVFFLCAIGTTLDALSKLRWNLYSKRVYAMTTDIYTNAISNWWRTIAKLEGLAQAIKHYAAWLPTPLDRLESLDQETERRDDLPYGAMPQGGVSLIMPLYNLLDFLKDKYTDALVQINYPFNECSPLSVEFRPVEWGIRIEFGLGIVKAVVEHSMQREATYIQLAE